MPDCIKIGNIAPEVRVPRAAPCTAINNTSCIEHRAQMRVCSVFKNLFCVLCFVPHQVTSAISHQSPPSSSSVDVSHSVSPARSDMAMWSVMWSTPYSPGLRGAKTTINIQMYTLTMDEKIMKTTL